MTFFFDNNLSERLTKGLRAFGEDVIHLKERFSEDTADAVWLKYVGENGFSLITRDERVRRNPAELTALRTYKVGVFFLGGKNMDRCKLTQQIVRNWPRIKEYSEKTRVPFAFRVPPTGTKFVSIPL